MFLYTTTVALLLGISLAYNNGQGLRPALGWNTWCSINKCGEDICNEVEIREVASAMKSNGMYDAGYTHVNLDDCWEACTRDKSDNIQPDSSRFPSGIKNLTSYIHSLGMTFGLYTSAGSSTCSSGTRSDCTPPGSYGYYTQDAQTFADWNVDYVKIDWCGSDLYNSTQQHTEFSHALNATGRSIWLELCRGYATSPPPDYVAQVANSWRVTGDHHDEWSSTAAAIESVAGNDVLSGKYNWAYNDFLMTGGQGCKNEKNPSNIASHCPGQSDTEYYTEYTMWVITASPLIVATDVRNMTSIMNSVLLNSEVIEINQENGTPAGNRISSQNCDTSVTNACQIWTRKMSDGSIALVLYNAGNDEHTFGVTFDELGMNWTENTQVSVRDLWKQSDIGDYTGYYNNSVVSHGVSFVRMYEKSKAHIGVSHLKKQEYLRQNKNKNTNDNGL